MITISDSRNRELEARSTGGASFVQTAALSLALTIAPYVHAQRVADIGLVRQTSTEGTSSKSLSLQINEVDVFKQINRVYDDLLRNQVELDADAKNVLYANLWDLYV